MCRKLGISRKRCEIRPKLLLITNRKWHTPLQMKWKSWTLNFYYYLFFVFEWIRFLCMRAGFAAAACCHSQRCFASSLQSCQRWDGLTVHVCFLLYLFYFPPVAHLKHTLSKYCRSFGYMINFSRARLDIFMHACIRWKEDVHVF